MELHFKDPAEADFRLYRAMQEWHNRIGDMLAYVSADDRSRQYSGGRLHDRDT